MWPNLNIRNDAKQECLVTAKKDRKLRKPKKKKEAESHTQLNSKSVTATKPKKQESKVGLLPPITKQVSQFSKTNKLDKSKHKASET